MKSCKNCEFALVEDIAQGMGGWLCAWGGMAYNTCSRYKDKRNYKNKIIDFLRRLKNESNFM